MAGWLLRTSRRPSSGPAGPEVPMAIAATSASNRQEDAIATCRFRKTYPFDSRQPCRTSCWGKPAGSLAAERRKILLSCDDARRLDYGGFGKIMSEFAIGQSVLRREDPRLLRGYGRFFDDLKLADQLHAAIVRSPHAHADITGIDTRAALQMPGVHAVLTGEDYRADGLGSLPSMARPITGAAAARCFCRRGRRLRSTVSCMSAIRSRWLSPMRSTKREMPPNASLSTMSRGQVSYRRATPSHRTRRSSTTNAPATRPISTRPATRPR